MLYTYKTDIRSQSVYFATVEQLKPSSNRRMDDPGSANPMIYLSFISLSAIGHYSKPLPRTGFLLTYPFVNQFLKL